tara:strand:- start:1622 stop:1816 length:195 start_codon:yes stop_codon:yes gene_type:complete
MGEINASEVGAIQVAFATRAWPKTCGVPDAMERNEQIAIRAESGTFATMLNGEFRPKRVARRAG